MDAAGYATQNPEAKGIGGYGQQNAIAPPPQQQETIPLILEQIAKMSSSLRDINARISDSLHYQPLPENKQQIPKEDPTVMGCLRGIRVTLQEALQYADKARGPLQL